jgi:hypothetical protein
MKSLFLRYVALCCLTLVIINRAIAQAAPYTGGDSRGEVGMEAINRELGSWSPFKGGTGRGEMVAIADVITIPVNMLYFRASLMHDNKVNLEWKAENETDNEYYNIQRSENGINYRVIGRMNTKSHISTGNTYSFIDASPANGMNYYRLEEVDKDADSHLSLVRVINFEKGGLNIRVFPNPFDDKISIQSSSSPEGLSYRLINTQGRIVKKGSLPQETMINAPDLSNGMYLLTILDDRGNIVYKMKLVRSGE